MWTVVNMVDRFCDRYDFTIVTRNYDSKGDTTPFTSVQTNEWNQCGNAQVFYASKEKLTNSNAAKLVRQIKPDLIYLNSALSKPVLNLLFARKKGEVNGIPVVLAPCGELAKGALSVKPLKKRLFLKYAKFFNLYRGVIWKASSDLEAIEIIDVIGKDCFTITAPDLAPKTILPDFADEHKPIKVKGSVKFIFLSRMVPKKNLNYFLERLNGIDEGAITLNIVGPLEDKKYWKDCLDSISHLSKNITVNIHGPVSYPKGLEMLFDNHFFVLPTLNENFGYVFLEALAAGCPLLISDRTVWNNIEEVNAGWAIPLENPDIWLDKLKYCIDMGEEEYLMLSKTARSYATNWLADPTLGNDTEKVLHYAFNSAAQMNVDQ